MPQVDRLVRTRTSTPGSHVNRDGEPGSVTNRDEGSVTVLDLTS
ncbi:hypothetical protein [Plantactinospora soyae]|uniref:Uncharacterized protein n=1 Tax=Plantactinospora soyae TaxID=1544732 RepID=A0A927MKC7_9ACTN|nr:hypothetical protein [Plantactinospora soyae]MBE1492760.1 hypothetical protein [Plantactinospora soyae]